EWDGTAQGWDMLGKFEPIELAEENFDDYFRHNIAWEDLSAKKIRRANHAAFSFEEGEEMYYLLQQKSGEIFLGRGWRDPERDPHSDDTLFYWLARLIPQGEAAEGFSPSEAGGKELKEAFGSDNMPDFFDIKLIDDLYFVGCSEGEKTGFAVFEQKSGELLYMEFMPEMLSRAPDVSVDYFTYGAEEYIVVLSENPELARIEWSGDHKASVWVEGAPAMVVEKYDALEKLPPGEEFTTEYKFYDANGAELGSNERPAATGKRVPEGKYLPYACIYMNPLSSYAATGGDSGYLYEIKGNEFIMTKRETGESKAIPVSEWEWQEMPYTEEEWNDLFSWEQNFNLKLGVGVSGYESASQLKYQPISDEVFLLGAEDVLWLVTPGQNPQMGDFLWNIYALAKKGAMGGATWQYRPWISSQYPAFAFDFGDDYVELSVFCDAGEIITRGTHKDGAEYETGGRILNSLQRGIIYWSPMDSESETEIVGNAELTFLLKSKDGILRTGKIYIEGEGGTGGFGTTYNAFLMAYGMRMSQSDEVAGGKIVSLFEAETDEKSLYSELLSREAFLDDANAISFLDLDMNGSSELIIYRQGGSSADIAEIYTIENGEIKAFSNTAAENAKEAVPESMNHLPNTFSAAYYTNETRQSVLEAWEKEIVGFFRFKGEDGEYFYLHSQSGSEDFSRGAYFRFYSLNGALAAEVLFSYADYSENYFDSDFSGKSFVNGKEVDKETLAETHKAWKEDFFSEKEIVATNENASATYTKKSGEWPFDF
ncbi:MAG: hypothetical protein IJC39_01595, partial [Firmicutes bacterium]|nr:hypothetical protein [Bacillota bacterium]